MQDRERICDSCFSVITEVAVQKQVFLEQGTRNSHLGHDQSAASNFLESDFLGVIASARR